MLSKIRQFAAAATCLGPGLASAAEQQAVNELPAMPLSDPAYLLQVFVSLVLVVAAIFLLSLLLRKFDITTPRSEGPIRVLHSVSIGGKEQLILVEIGDEQILVGRSPGRISAIQKLEQPISGLDTKANLPPAQNLIARLFNGPLS